MCHSLCPVTQHVERYCPGAFTNVSEVIHQASANRYRNFGLSDRLNFFFTGCAIAGNTNRSASRVPYILRIIVVLRVMSVYFKRMNAFRVDLTISRKATYFLMNFIPLQSSIRNICSVLLTSNKQNTHDPSYLYRRGRHAPQRRAAAVRKNNSRNPNNFR